MVFAKKNQAGLSFLFGLIAFVFILSEKSIASPAVTASEARAFLGGRSGKVVYLKDYDSRLYYIDLNDSILRERSIAPDQYCNSPMIHPDGTRIVYESLGSIYIRFLEENSQSRFTILTAPVKAGYFYEPRWWLDSKNGDEYIIYTTGYLEEHEWPQKSGQTYLQKIVKNLPVGAPTMLLPFMMGGGRSKDGLWGATSNHTTGMFKFVPGKIDSAFYSLNNWMDSGFFLGCNPSISTSKDPTRQNRMMHLSSGQGTVRGKVYENHKAIYIRSWKDKSINDPLWYIGTPGDNCNNDSSGNLFWNFPEWSNDENYFVSTGSKEIDIVTEGDLYFTKINFGSQNKILRIMKGGSKFYFPCLWIQDGIQPAKIKLDKNELNFSALKKDSTNPQSQIINITNSGDGTLPPISIGNVTKWIKTALSPSGNNAFVLSVMVLRDIVLPGDYVDTISVSFGSGVESQLLIVKFKLSDPILTKIITSPSSVILLPNDSIELQAEAFDQVGNPILPLPAIEWKGMDGLNINAQGKIIADSIPFHASYAIAKIGTVSCTTFVWVAMHSLKIDASAKNSSNGWQSDSSFGAGTKVFYTTDSIINLINIKNFAPSAIYQSYRYPAPNYNFTELPNGRYRVRFHFTSLDSILTTQAINFSIKLQGTIVLDNYLLPVSLKKGQLIADVKEASVSVTNGKGLSIEFIGKGGGISSAISGIEIYDEGVAPILVSKPNGGETFILGDTLAILWSADSQITSCGIQISLDSGTTWHAITRRKSVQRTDENWGNYKWAIPDTLDSLSLVSNKVMVSVYDYFGADRDRSDEPFSIKTKSISIFRQPQIMSRNWFGGVSNSGKLFIHYPVSGNYTLTLFDLRERKIKSISSQGYKDQIWDLSPASPGIYQIKIQGLGWEDMRIFPLL